MNMNYFGRQIPVVGSYDVVIAGGGFAGLSSAVIAAGRNLRVALIERSSRLGGSAVLSGVPNFCTSGKPLDNDNPLWAEILTQLRLHNAIGSENGFVEKYNPGIHTRDFGFSAPVLECVLLDIAVKSGIDIFLQTDVIDAVCENGSVNCVIIQNESLHQAISGGAFIDATGDGILSMLSGGEALPNADESGLAPIPPAFRVYIRNQSHGADGAVTIKMNLKEDATLTAESRNSTELRVRNGVMSVVNDYNSANDGDFRLDGTPERMPVRESRRIRGDYVLTVSDVRGGAHFDDAVANCDFIIDTVHNHELVPEYQIPYRSLLVKNVENLLVVGRCFSADRGAMSSARTMATASLMGQAAGAAAALSIERLIPLRAVSAADIVSAAHTLPGQKA